MKNSVRHYPVFLKLGGKKCLVVGGGNVAFRKVTALLDCGAVIEIISPDLCPQLADLVEQGRVSYCCRHYRVGDLHTAFLTFAATSNAAVNRLVAGEAHDLGIPVNVADDAAISNFIVPSSSQKGDVAIAVATAGTSPALARVLRQKLEVLITTHVSMLADIVGALRKELMQRGIRYDGETWEKALDLDLLLPLLEEGKNETVKTTLKERLAAYGSEAL